MQAETGLAMPARCFLRMLAVSGAPAARGLSGPIAGVRQSAIRWSFGLSGDLYVSAGGTDAVSSPAISSGRNHLP